MPWGMDQPFNLDKKAHECSKQPIKLAGIVMGF